MTLGSRIDVLWILGSCLLSCYTFLDTRSVPRDATRRHCGPSARANRGGTQRAGGGMSGSCVL